MIIVYHKITVISNVFWRIFCKSEKIYRLYHIANYTSIYFTEQAKRHFTTRRNNSMEELRRNDHTISVSETVFEGQAEQGVELDYVLPDYYPEIFKILCCRMTPKTVSYSMLGDSKLLIDGNVDIRVLYLAENSSSLHCIEQHYTYSKTVDLGRSIIPDGGNVSIKLQPKPDYCNCRAVSGRRIDIRGAVSTKVLITAEKSRVLPSIPQNVEVRNRAVDCCSKLISGEKQFTCKEEIETGASGIAYIIRSAVIPKVTDLRIIADKAIVKGTMTVSASYGIYDPENQGCSTAEQMTADIPISQIIDLDGIDESFNCHAQIDVLNCELSCATDSGIIGCNIIAVCRLICRKESTIEIPCDVYSTEYETEFASERIKLLRSCNTLNKTMTVKSVCEYSGGELESVIDCSADIYNLSCRMDGTELILSGLICYQALCRDAQGVPFFMEKQEGFECSTPTDSEMEADSVSFTALCTDTDYSIRSDGALDITAKIELNADLCSNLQTDIIQSVTILEDKPKTNRSDYALRICYADGEDDCWTIAKRYGTSVDAVMNENDIEDRDALLSGMILIPSLR